MALSAGENVGPFEILGTLGRGGMGEVYRARDPRLERDVALKVIREGAANSDSLSRFQRETRAVAALNHPGILAIYDTGLHGGAPYAVMELLAGETLAERLQAGPLPAREASEIAARVADALAAAHAHGVVHRDVKPSNIFLTEDGQTKVLDFGIARVLRADSPGGATESTLDQTSGALVGTAGYVSPEQVRGRDADARSDVFSLGATLYETLTGRKVFAGATPAETLSAVLTVDPSGYGETARVTPELRRIALRCLEKDPANRYQSARDLALDLRAFETGALAGVSPPASLPRSRPGRWLGAAFAGGLLLATGLFLGPRLRPDMPPSFQGPVTRVALSLSPPLTVTTAERALFAISPDGEQLVYVADVDGKLRLVLRDMASLETHVLPATEEATGPFFSPDGRWIGFVQPSAMKKLSLAGGTAVLLHGVPPVTRGASWGPEETIVYSDVNTGGLLRLSAATGEQKSLVLPDYDRGEQTYRWPEVLPGGKAALFTIYTGGDTFDAAMIAAVRLDTGEKKILVRGGTSPHYSPTRHLVYAQGGTLFAVPFDLEKLEVAGAAAPLVSGVRTEATGVAQFAFAGNGTLVYLLGPSPNAPQYRLARVDRTGQARPLAATGALYGPRFSPDGKRLAFSKGDANQDVWIADLERSTVTRLTPEASEEFDPVWSPDGKRVAYASERRNTPPQIFVRAADGSGDAEPLWKKDVAVVPHSWSPDGKVLAFIEWNHQNGWDIWTLETVKGAKAKPFLATPHAEAEPDFSPDGRWVAYVSNESGRVEVYARPFPGPGGKVLISNDGGAEPAWSRDGKELFYRNGERMMAVPVRLEAELSVGRPAVLFERAGFYANALLEQRTYDVTADGKSFAMVQLPDREAPAAVPILVANWFAELTRKAAAAAN